MSKAKQLLRDTTMTVYDIAPACGYRNDRTFYRAFVGTEHITPGEFCKGRR